MTTTEKFEPARMLWFGVGRTAVAKLPAAGLLLVTPDNRVLLTHRSPWMNDGNLWSNPGGVSEPGESMMAAAVRETEEELHLGLTLADLNLRTHMTTWNLRRSYTVYVCDVEDELEIGEIDESENQDAAWVDLDYALEKLPLHHQLLPLLRALKAGTV